MNIDRLNIINFRNYQKETIILGKGMNIFLGENGSGKTNILESISVLALTKSHRVGDSPNLIRFGTTKTKIMGKIKDNKIIKNLEVEIGIGYKNLKKNKTEIKKISDYISNLNVIVFAPDDLEIIKGSPNIRRNLLNVELSQISKTYLNTYNEYNKILKTRNEYLKILFTSGLADKQYLHIITDKLIEKAVIIYTMRNDFINKVNEHIDKIYDHIANSEGLKMIYENNIGINHYDEEELRKKLKHLFFKNEKREIMNGMTLYGPHRDDFTFFLHDKDLKYFGSQGQQKLTILSLKLSLIPIFKELTNSYPVLLLDDIFSELDIKKRNKLLKYINKDIQSIITTTDLKNINKRYLDNCNIYSVNKGKVERIE